MKAILLLAATGLAVLASVPARASLIGATINADITLQGQDDSGFYTVTVLNGPISVGNGFTSNTSFFRQNTNMGFHTASNELTGTIGLGITANAITLSFNGQAQPFSLNGSFTNLPPTVLADTETSSGFMPGVSLALPDSFTANSAAITAFYLGFQPGTSTSQTDTLLFGPPPNPTPVPEPASLALFGAGLLGLYLTARPTRRPFTKVRSE